VVTSRILQGFHVCEKIGAAVSPNRPFGLAAVADAFWTSKHGAGQAMPI